MAKKTTKKAAEKALNIDNILFNCRDILRAARNSGSFFEKRDMMLTLVFLRFIGEKYEDGIENLRQTLIEQGLDPDDEDIRTAFFDDATFADGTYNLPVEARWSTIINTPAPSLNVALDTALHSIATTSKDLKGCFIEGTFTTRNLGANDIKKLVDEVNKISHKDCISTTLWRTHHLILKVGMMKTYRMILVGQIMELHLQVMPTMRGFYICFLILKSQMVLQDFCLLMVH